jgi:hypothetical protein
MKNKCPLCFSYGFTSNSKDGSDQKIHATAGMPCSIWLKDAHFS